MPTARRGLPSGLVSSTPGFKNPAGGCRWERWGPCAKYCEIRPDKGRKTSIWLTFRANMVENNEIVQSKISLQPKYDSVLNAAGRAAISRGFGVPPTGRGRRKFAVVLTRGRPARAALRFIQTTGVMLPPKKAVSYAFSFSSWVYFGNCVGNVCWGFCLRASWRWRRTQRERPGSGGRGDRRPGRRRCAGMWATRPKLLFQRGWWRVCPLQIGLSRSVHWYDLPVLWDRNVRLLSKPAALG